MSKVDVMKTLINDLTPREQEMLETLATAILNRKGGNKSSGAARELARVWLEAVQIAKMPKII